MKHSIAVALLFLGCSDDAHSSADAGTFAVQSNHDGLTCVTISLADYDRSCTTAADCATAFEGETCRNQCEASCGDAPISAHELKRFQAALGAVTLGWPGVTCNCPALYEPMCLNGVCTVQTPGKR